MSKFKLDNAVSEKTVKEFWNYLVNELHLHKVEAAGILGSIYQESRLNHSAKNGSYVGVAQLGGSKLKAYQNYLKNNNLEDNAYNQLRFIHEYISNVENDTWTNEYNNRLQISALPKEIIRKKGKDGKIEEIEMYVTPDGKTYPAKEYDKYLIENFNPFYVDYSYEAYNNIDWDSKTSEEAAYIYTHTFERPGQNDKSIPFRQEAAKYFHDTYGNLESFKNGGNLYNDGLITIYIENKEYKVLIAKSESEKTQGLSDVESLDSNEGMLFDYSDDPQDSLVFNTLEMDFSIDIVFINDDDEVVAVELGEPKSEELIECQADSDEKIKYVLEVNANSGIEIGDELDFEDDSEEEDITKMYILGSDGKPQMDLVGGERIISRKETKQIIKKAKKANKSKSDSDYKKLGKYIFKVLQKQDSREPEYVSSPK